MTKLKFTKMQGLGNDFVILDYVEYQKSSLKDGDLALRLCNRNFGIGADGLIIVNPNAKETDIGWFFFNSDGTIAQMCGNGIRCFARYVYEKGLVNKKKFSVDTKAGVIIPEILDDKRVKVNMSKPVLEPKKIPVLSEKNLNFEIPLKERTFIGNAVSMGNPHCVIMVNEDTKALAKTYGSEIEHHPLFPEKVNVEFIKILNEHEMILDVWERGCGITLACGTGACASTVAAILNGRCKDIVKVNLPGGALTIEWDGVNDIYMTGSAEFVFTGEIDV